MYNNQKGKSRGNLFFHKKPFDINLYDIWTTLAGVGEKRTISQATNRYSIQEEVYSLHIIAAKENNIPKIQAGTLIALKQDVGHAGKSKSYKIERQTGMVGFLKHRDVDRDDSNMDVNRISQTGMFANYKQGCWAA